MTWEFWKANAAAVSARPCWLMLCASRATETGNRPCCWPPAWVTTCIAGPDSTKSAKLPIGIDHSRRDIYWTDDATPLGDHHSVYGLCPGGSGQTRSSQTRSVGRL